MTTEAVALVPEPAPAPSLEAVPDPPVEVTIAEIAAGVASALVEAGPACGPHRHRLSEAPLAWAVPTDMPKPAVTCASVSCRRR